jgi:hypothetical protein
VGGMSVERQGQAVGSIRGWGLGHAKSDPVCRVHLCINVRCLLRDPKLKRDEGKSLCSRLV